jgi:hypothetical protein
VPPAPPAARPKPAPGPPAPAPVLTETEGSTAPALARLDQSAQAYQRASALHEAVADHLRRIDSRTEHPLPTAAPAHRTARAPEIASVRALLARPASARQAVIAAAILGPCRGMEPL